METRTHELYTRWTTAKSRYQSGLCNLCSLKHAARLYRSARNTENKQLKDEREHAARVAEDEAANESLGFARYLYGA